MVELKSSSSYVWCKMLQTSKGLQHKTHLARYMLNMWETRICLRVLGTWGKSEAPLTVPMDRVRRRRLDSTHLATCRRDTPLTVSHGEMIGLKGMVQEGILKGHTC